MTDIEMFIKSIISKEGESETIEFKENQFNPDEIGEYISALSNSACYGDQREAFLIFGVDNDGNIVGTEVDLKKKKKGNEELELWLSRLLSPRINFQILNIKIEEKPLSLILIPSAVNQPVRFKNDSFIRIGTNKKNLREFPEIEREIWRKAGLYEFENDVALGSVSADEILELLDYQTFYKLMAEKITLDQKRIIERLSKDNLIKQNKGKFDITNLGAVLFANDLRKFNHLAKKGVRVIEYKDESRITGGREQVGAKGYAVGFEGLIEFINNILPINEEIEKSFRKVVKLYPEIAIRELVANAIIHQDFLIKGTRPMVEIFKDRIEISNPGKPLIETLRFIDHPPKSRNEKLSDLMRRMNVCEERGSGIDKVITSIEQFQLPAPEFIADEDSLKVILYGKRSLIKMKREDKIRACYQHCVLKYVSNDFMTNTTLRERFKIDDKNYSLASRIIKDTIEADFIKEYDPDNKANRYSKYIPFWAG